MATMVITGMMKLQLMSAWIASLIQNITLLDVVVKQLQDLVLADKR